MVVVGVAFHALFDGYIPFSADIAKGDNQAKRMELMLNEVFC